MLNSTHPIPCCMLQAGGSTAALAGEVSTESTALSEEASSIQDVRLEAAGLESTTTTESATTESATAESATGEAAIENAMLEGTALHSAAEEQVGLEQQAAASPVAQPADPSAVASADASGSFLPCPNLYTHSCGHLYLWTSLTLTILVKSCCVSCTHDVGPVLLGRWSLVCVASGCLWQLLGCLAVHWTSACMSFNVKH